MKRTVLKGATNSFFDRDGVRGDRFPFRSINEFKSRILRQRFQLQNTVGELTPSVNLADEASFLANGSPDAFTIKHLQWSELRFDVKFARESILNLTQVSFTDTKHHKLG